MNKKEQELNELLQQEKIERFIDQLEYWGDLTDLKKENEKLENKLEKIKNRDHPKYCVNLQCGVK